MSTAAPSGGTRSLGLQLQKEKEKVCLLLQVGAPLRAYLRAGLRAYVPARIALTHVDWDKGSQTEAGTDSSEAAVVSRSR